MKPVQDAEVVKNIKKKKEKKEKGVEEKEWDDVDADADTDDDDVDARIKFIKKITMKPTTMMMMTGVLVWTIVVNDG